MAILVFKIPVLNRVDLKSGILTIPRWVPLILQVVELIDRVWVIVGPGFAESFWEIRVGSTDSQVHDDVEFSVEGSGVWLSLPRVEGALRKLTFLKEALLCEIDLQNFLAIIIDVCVESILVPVETVSVEIVS